MADLNLLAAIRLAACPIAGGRGVLTVLNNEIQSAQDVTKMNAFRVETFITSGALGFSGLRGCGCEGGLLPRCDPSAYDGDTV